MPAEIIAKTPEPALNHKFVVTVTPDGSAASVGGTQTSFNFGVSKITGLGTDAEFVNYREGDEPTTMRKYRGLTTYDNIMIEKGVNASETQLLDWITASVQESENSYRSLIIDVYGRGSKIIRRYTVSKAQAKAHKTGDLDSMGNEILKDTLEIVHEGLELASSPSA